jgi:hypothetical protein
LKEGNCKGPLILLCCWSSSSNYVVADPELVQASVAAEAMQENHEEEEGK